MRRAVAFVLFVATGLMGTLAVAPPAQAADTGLTAPQSGRIVSEAPSTKTPNILDGTVYSIAQVGNLIIVGGQFTQVQNAGSTATLTRKNILAFDATTGVVSTDFVPEANGTVYKVQAAADGSSVYIGGSFTSIFGATAKNLVEADVPTATRVTGFKPPSIDGAVRDLEVTGRHLWVAGKFTHFGGSARAALGTLNATTGAADPYFSGVFAGLHNPSVTGAVTDVLQLSTNAANTQLVAVGNFLTVDGASRAQIVKLDISGASSYQLSGWNTNLYKSGCSPKFDTYMSDVEFAPDGSYFAVSTTGAWGGPTSNQGTSGCDVVARFESGTSTLSAPTWTAYTGGDTTWTIEVTDNVIYAGGHQRWQNNPTAGDAAGQGAVERTGIAALNPVNGMAYSWNPTRTRGVGIQDMMATSQGLYVGSDTDIFGRPPGNTKHGDIAFVPLATGKALTPVTPVTLPADVYTVATGQSQLVDRTFTGTSVTSTSNAPTGPGWNTSVGAFMINGTLYTATSNGTLSKQTFDGTTYGTTTEVATADALVPQTDWHNTDVPRLTSLFFAGGRIYFTRSDSSLLFNRGFEPESDIVGQQRFSTTAPSGVSYATMRGAFVAGGNLYYADSVNRLFRATWSGTAPVGGTATQVSGPGKDAQTWASRAMFAYQGPAQPANQPPVAVASISCDKLACAFSAAGSNDPDGSIVSYDWDFGDNTPHGSGATTTHSYNDAGDRSVTLTVTDNRGATSQAVRTASPSTVADSVSFVASANTNGNRLSHSVTIPSTVKAGDALLLFFSANSVTKTYTGPSGWTQLEAPVGTDLSGRIYSRTATAADPGSTVAVTSSGYVKSDLTVAAYRGVSTSQPVASSASTVQNTAAATHTTPNLTADNGNGWLVSYWGDKGLTSTWAGPAGQTQRSLGGTSPSSGHMSSLLEDSNTTVSSGLQGGLTATADTSARGLSASILLAGSGAVDPPANQQPVADAGTPSCTDLTCTFDGASSSDPDAGDTLSYLWNFGDGTTSTIKTTTHTYATGGTRTVTLTVTDNHGASNTATTTANPTNPAPNTAPTAVASVDDCTGGATCQFTGGASTDPDTDTLTYDWNFGDGSPHDTTANPTHTYGSAGPFTVTLTVNDGHGHSDTATVTASPTVTGGNTAPTATAGTPTCSDLTCTFAGTGSDPDGDPITYDWDFGDGSAHATTANASHTYASPGTRTAVLTVADDHGHNGTDSVTVSPTTTTGPGITAVAATSTNGNRTTHAVTVPGGVQAGDTLLTFFTANSTSSTYTGPAGWTLVESQDGNGIVVRAWTKVATAGDLGSSVRVTSSAYAKSDLTVAAYRGTAAGPTLVSASSVDNTAGAAHVSPAVTASGSSSWVVTYWADKSSSTTAWASPAGQSPRTQSFGTSSGHVSALLADSGGPVPAGPAGGLTATANSASSRGASVSIVLPGS
ncbi:MAG: PKD domain-containing protein [Nocardioidaceae bacterium]